VSNEFNLERAKAGEPVEYKISTGKCEFAHFIGTAIDGAPVIQIGRRVFLCDESELRMAPKKVKVRYRLALIDAFIAGPRVIAANTDHEAAQCAVRGDFMEWLTDWIETEITE